MSEKILLGSVVGPVGPEGPQGNDYVLTEEDKVEIAQKVGEQDWLAAAVITVNCIHDYSELPVWATVKLLNADGVLMEQSEYAAEQKKFKVTPFTDYILRFEADGYQAVADYSISSIPKAGVVVTKRFVPSTAVTFTVDYKVDGTTVQHKVVDPHASVSYTGDPISVSGKVWIGWDNDDASGVISDVTEDTVLNAVFVIPEQPAEIKDLSLYSHAYSDVSGDNPAYTLEELSWILLNNAAKTYLPKRSVIRFKMPPDWPTGDIDLEFCLETYNHFKVAGTSDFALTTWLMDGVLTTGRRMHSSGSNSGGWPAIEASTYIETTYFAKLPQYLRSIIKEVEVLSSAGNMSAAIVSKNNHLWLASYTEIFGGNTTVPYAQEIDSGAEEKQFPYYTSNSTRIKKQYNGDGSAQDWWLRSPDSSSSSSFRNVSYYGPAYSSSATNAIYWALGFCV